MTDVKADGFAHFDLGAMSKADGYKLLVSTIMPRPIAWVVSRDAEGLNAAPFSFFNILSADPPLVAIGFGTPTDRDEKDTLANIRAQGEFVVNLVPEELAQAMNVTATNAPRGTDETRLAGLELAKCEVVNVPRIVGSPVGLECKLFQVIETGGTGTIVLGRIVYAHVRESAFAKLEKLYVDPSQLRLIGRMHGAGGYCTTRDTFTIDRLTWPLEGKD
jgi:flavin reductase (DIM6/NTAB) family NADH-FMN oxidoreductase RutF